MKYILDTCVITDFVKGEKNTLIKIQNTSPRDIAISAISVMEIQYGFSLHPNRIKTIKPVINDFLSHINVLDFTPKDAESAARIRASLKQRGCPIGAYDVLLAGAALNRQCVLVSANVKEFERIEQLKLENWRLR